MTVRERPVVLTQKEYALLLALVREPTSVRTKQELLRSVWGYRTTGVTRTIDSHACRLRRKLGVYGDEFIVNVWGVGYRLVDAGPPLGEATSLAPDQEPAADDAEPLAVEEGHPADGADLPARDGVSPETGVESTAVELVVDRRDDENDSRVRAIAPVMGAAPLAQRSVLGGGGAPTLLLGSGEASS